MQPLQQALQEYPEQAVPYAAIRRLLGAPQPATTVQMWARVGYAQAVPPAPRRTSFAHEGGGGPPARLRRRPGTPDRAQPA